MKWKRARGIACGKFEKKSGNKNSSSNLGVSGEENYDDEDDDEFDDYDDDEFDMDDENDNENNNETDGLNIADNLDKFKLEFINKQQNFKISSYSNHHRYIQ